MKFKILKEERLNGKEYIFRGVSRPESTDQSNYSRKFKTDLSSRYYSYEIFEGIYTFGDVQVFELLDDSNIWHYEDSVEEFISEYDLEDYESKWLYSIYKIHTLAEAEGFDYHDLYHSQQLVATEYLETHTNYDGIEWYEAMDTPEIQLQIWNNKIVKKLTTSQARKVIEQLAAEYPDSIYTKDYRGGLIGNSQFQIYGEFDTEGNRLK